MLCRLAKDEGGASLVEMAMVLPVLASLLVGIVDVSRAFSAKLDLQQAAERTIEKVQQYQTDGRTETLRAEAASAAGVSPNNVTVDSWLECNGVRQADSQANCGDGEVPGRWIKVKITSTFSPMFASSRWPGSNSDGTYTIHGDAGLRTQ